MKRFLITVLGGLLGGVLGAVAFDVAGYFTKAPVVEVATVDQVAHVVTPPVPVAPDPVDAVNPTFGEVKASAFTLVNEKGKVRAALAVRNGGSMFALSGPDGHPRIMIGVEEDNARIFVSGEDKKSGVGFSARSDGIGFLITDANGANRLTLGLVESKPWVSLQDAAGNVTWSTDRR